MRTHRWRVGVVFAGLLASTVALPVNAHQWVRITRDVTGPGSFDDLQATLEPDLGYVSAPEHVGLIGMGRGSAARWASVPGGRVDLFVAAPDRPRSDASEAPKTPSVCREFASPPARAIKLARGRYDLIIQSGASSAGTAGACWTLEWFRRIRGLLGDRGRIFVDVPLDGLTLDGAQVISATFAETFGSKAVYRLVATIEAGPRLLLHAWTGRGDGEPTVGPAWRPVQDLWRGRESVALHTIRSPVLLMRGGFARFTTGRGRLTYEALLRLSDAAAGGI